MPQRKACDRRISAASIHAEQCPIGVKRYRIAMSALGPFIPQFQT